MVRRRATGLVLLVVALALATYFVDVDAAKKKKKKAGSKSVPAKVDSIKCGVCFAMVDEIVYELKKTENSTSTLDLRWGLTSEVTDGRAKRIGKVIPYKRSQLRAIEVMEGLCETMKNYGTDNAMPGEPRLGRSSKRPDEDNRDMEMVNRLKIDADDHKKFENYCEDYIESREDMITKAIREGQTSVEMEDIICFGDSSAPCGTTRHLCPIGSKGPMNGTMPCSLCPQGTFSSKPGTTECVKCPQHTNTTATGTNSSKGCVALCKPGFFGSSESGT